MARPLCTARVVGRGLWGASSARSLVGEYIYSVHVRVVNKPGFCRGSSVELVIRRDEGQPGEALGLPGGVHREDGGELYGIIPTEGIGLSKPHGLRDQERRDVDLTVLMGEIIG